MPNLANNLSSGLGAGSAATVTVADAAADTTTWPMLATSQTGNIAPATNAGLTYNASTNLLTSGSVDTTAGYYYGGTGSPLSVELSRALPTTVGNYVEIGAFVVNNGAHALRMTISNCSSGFSTAQSYIITGQYNGTTNVWEEVPPISDTGTYGGHRYALDIKINGNGLDLRMRRTSGTAAATVEIRIESTGKTADVFTEASGTGAAGAVTVFYQPFYQSTISKRVGIGNVSPTSTLDVSGIITTSLPIAFNRTITAGGTTGAQTIDKPAGTVNFAAAATTLVVTNNLVTTSSIVMAVVRTNDTTATIKNIVPAGGSFTITLTAAATAETSVGFIVYN